MWTLVRNELSLILTFQCFFNISVFHFNVSTTNKRLWGFYLKSLYEHVQFSELSLIKNTEGNFPWVAIFWWAIFLGGQYSGRKIFRVAFFWTTVFQVAVFRVTIFLEPKFFNVSISSNSCISNLNHFNSKLINSLKTLAGSLWKLVYNFKITWWNKYKSYLKYALTPCTTEENSTHSL